MSAPRHLATDRGADIILAVRCPVCGAGDARPPRCINCRRPLLDRRQSDYSLRLNGVTKRYGSGDASVTAVTDLDLAVGHGEVVLLAGPSGSGKTTALLLMGLMLKPDAGTVDVRGVPASSVPPSALPQLRLLTLGFVFQQFNLLASLTAEQNVALPLRMAGVKPKAAAARAGELLAELALRGRRKHRPAELSGGQKQRVAIARALALGPDVVLADEPTANLDSEAGHRVMDHLARLARSRGSSVVVVTHDTRFADVADRVLQLEDGLLVGQGRQPSADGLPGRLPPDHDLNQAARNGDASLGARGRVSGRAQ